MVASAGNAGIHQSHLHEGLLGLAALISAVIGLEVLQEELGTDAAEELLVTLLQVVVRVLLEELRGTRGSGSGGGGQVIRGGCEHFDVLSRKGQSMDKGARGRVLSSRDEARIKRDIHPRAHELRVLPVHAEILGEVSEGALLIPADPAVAHG